MADQFPRASVLVASAAVAVAASRSQELLAAAVLLVCAAAAYGLQSRCAGPGSRPMPAGMACGACCAAPGAAVEALVDWVCCVAVSGSP